MAPRVPADQSLRLRMQAQRLAGARSTTVPEVLRDVFALQAQDTAATRLAVRARSQQLDVGVVNRAWNKDRSVVRTWAMRGTLHLLMADDVRWVVDLLGPWLVARDRRPRAG